jgi:hypothetical protein
LILDESENNSAALTLIFRSLSKHAHQVSRHLPVSWVPQRSPSSKLARVYFINTFVSLMISLYINR